jgi:hypothetical protein
MKARDERSRRLAYPQADPAPKSNPSPGTMISLPVFGYELFVAQVNVRLATAKAQPKLIHNGVRHLNRQMSSVQKLATGIRRP